MPIVALFVMAPVYALVSGAIAAIIVGERTAQAGG